MVENRFRLDSQYSFSRCSNWSFLFLGWLQSLISFMGYDVWCNYSHSIFQQIYYENFPSFVRWYGETLDLEWKIIFLRLQICFWHVFHNCSHGYYCWGFNLLESLIRIWCGWRVDFDVFLQCFHCKFALDTASTILHS